MYVCCILHNFLLLNGEPLGYGEEDIVQDQVDTIDSISETLVNSYMRDELVNFFWAMGDRKTPPNGIKLA